MFVLSTLYRTLVGISAGDKSRNRASRSCTAQFLKLRSAVKARDLSRVARDGESNARYVASTNGINAIEKKKRTNNRKKGKKERREE